MGAALPKALLVWFGILLLAIVNGIGRDKILIPALGGFAGLLLSGVLLSACIFVVAWAASPWWGPLASRQLLALGLLWLALTLAFEFGFGRLVQHKNWSDLLRAYTFRDGNLWPIVLVVTFVSPWLAYRVRGAT